MTRRSAILDLNAPAERQHGTGQRVHLLNRDLPAASYNIYRSSTLDAQPGQPTGSSKLCLSCHAGSDKSHDEANEHWKFLPEPLVGGSPPTRHPSVSDDERDVKEQLSPWEARPSLSVPESARPRRGVRPGRVVAIYSVSKDPSVIVWFPLESIANTSNPCSPVSREATNSGGTVTLVLEAGRVT